MTQDATSALLTERSDREADIRQHVDRWRADRRNDRSSYFGVYDMTAHVQMVTDLLAMLDSARAEQEAP